MTQPLCQNRIPDHTDFVDCGNPVLPGNTYCIECRPHKLTRARHLMESHEQCYLDAKRAYEALLAEGVPKP